MVVLAGAGAAAAIDLRSRRIPNAVTVPLVLAGLGLSVAGIGDVTLGSALVGVALGLLLMLPGYAIGATGAGDLKLLAAMGAVLGARQILVAFIYMAIAGGLLAVAFAIRRRRLTCTLWRAASLVAAPSSTGAAIKAEGAANRFPYGPAIAAGCALAALGI